MAADGQPVIRYFYPGYYAPSASAILRPSGETPEPRPIASVCVRNLAYVYAPHSEYPLAPLVRGPIGGVVAYAVDMDGTSTTTEPLALHALEYMVRRFTGRLTAQQWPGLDRQRDYPHVIGHSNQHHTEYLLKRYEAEFRPAALREAFAEALAWTLAHLPGTPRAHQVLDTARICGLRAVVEDGEFRRAALEAGRTSPDRPAAGRAEEVAARLRSCLGLHMAAFRCDEWGPRVRAALDIYYMRYHSILMRAGGDAADDRDMQGLLHGIARRLIEPMPGYAAFVATIKGWLGREITCLRDEIRASLDEHEEHRSAAASPDGADAFDALARVAESFESRPARLALVTASIAFEAETVMDQVLVRTAEQVRDWPVSAQRKERMLAELSERRRCFDAFITADDACEHRLKPHPDLYSLALARMGIEPGDYARCIGLEDTEPGIVSQRAAGIGCAVALPNGDTHRQDFRAAAHVIAGGLPELLAAHRLLAGPAGATTGPQIAGEGGS